MVGKAREPQKGQQLHRVIESSSPQQLHHDHPNDHQQPTPTYATSTTSTTANMWITCIIQLSTTNQQPMTYDNGFISSSSSYLLLPWWSRDSYDKLSPWHIPGVSRVSLPKLHKVEGTALIHSLSSINRGRHTKIYMHRALHPPKFIRLDLEGAVESFRIWPCLTDFLIQLFYNCFFLGLEGIFRILQSIAHAQQIRHFVRLQLLARRQGKTKRQFVHRTNEMCNSCRKPTNTSWIRSVIVPMEGEKMNISQPWLTDITSE